MSIRLSLLLLFFITLLSACGTTDGSLRQQGKSEAYILGFHDGRHSGMREAGNNFEHYIKDNIKYESDPDYQAGWLAGEQEGKELQQQASSIGNAAAGVYSVSEGNHHSRDDDIDQAAKDAVKGVDTSGMDQLGK